MDGFPCDNCSNSIGECCQEQGQYSARNGAFHNPRTFCTVLPILFRKPLDFYPVDIFSVISVLADDPLHTQDLNVGLATCRLHPCPRKRTSDRIGRSASGAENGRKRWIAIYVIGLVGGI